MAPRPYELQSSDVFPSTALLADAEEVQNPQNLISSCLLTLQCSGAMGWGIRRKVRYIGRHREMLYQKGKGKSEHKEEDEEEEEAEEVVVEVEEKRRPGRKRKRESTRKIKIKKKKKKIKRKELKKPKHEKNNKRNCDDEQRVKGSKDRWSLERYESAEMKLLEIMREKGAELGNPILRQALREEARKHIGDTGLLDHLLKHMAGKIVTDGRERFRRRHNAEGAMEYWLEPADLVEFRRKAGVMDPYWVPPGWQPGDAASPFPCGPEIKKGMDELREELTNLKREMEQVCSLKHVEKMAFDAQSQAQNVSRTWQEKYERLLKQNSKREEEIASMSRSLLALKEEIYLLKQGEMKFKATEVAAVTEDNAISEGGSQKKGEEKRKKMETGHKCTNNSNISIQADGSNADKSDNNNNKDNSSVGDGANRNGGSSCVGGKKATRKSGFRICKPQGTFLWPNMAGGTNLTTGSCSRAATTSEGSSPRPQGMMAPATSYATMTMTTSSVVSLEGHLMMFGGEPTPPSVSSTSASPKLLLPSPTSPVQQLTRPPFAKVFVGPTYALHHNQQSQGLGLVRRASPPQLQERTASSDNISSPVSMYYHHQQIPNEVSTPQQLPRGASPRQGKKEGVALRAAHWKSDNGGAMSDLSTDLALAIPSSYS